MYTIHDVSPLPPKSWIRRLWYTYRMWILKICICKFSFQLKYFIALPEALLVKTQKRFHKHTVPSKLTDPELSDFTNLKKHVLTLRIISPNRQYIKVHILATCCSPRNTTILKYFCYNLQGVQNYIVIETVQV